jgi:hypothetical protein
MPYIPQSDREKFDVVLGELDLVIKEFGLSNGELNYLMTMLGNRYIARHGLSYNTGADVIKALECAKMEFARRVLYPYENQKCFENGDVF